MDSTNVKMQKVSLTSGTIDHSDVAGLLMMKFTKACSGLRSKSAVFNTDYSRSMEGKRLTLR